MFTGSFIDPSTGKRTNIDGILFTKQTMADGYFLSRLASGSIELLP
jgi:hypothetical protein